MKSLLFVVIALFTANQSYAAKIGDQAIYAGTFTMSGQTLPVTLNVHITSFDAATSNFSVETTQVVGGQSQTRVEQKNADQIGSEEEASGIIAKCAAYGGINQMVVLASSSETLSTCKITQTTDGKTQEINFAAVPFMIANYVENIPAKATALNLKLFSYVRGN